MAPVIDIEVLDGRGGAVRNCEESIGAVPHRVLITSEEQLKLFSLPGLVAAGKYKVTANEGCLVRRARAASLHSLAEPGTPHHCVLFLSSTGQISAFSLPELRCLMKVSAVKPDNHIGISSFVFSSSGRGLYMSSYSELQEVSVAAAAGCRAVLGRVPLPSLGPDIDTKVCVVPTPRQAGCRACRCAGSRRWPARPPSLSCQRTGWRPT